MAYTTKLMEEILDDEPISESAKTAIQRVTHKYGEAYTVLWLFKAIGLEYDEYFQYVNQLQNQVVPQTVEEWALPYWERSLGLSEDNTLSIEARRQRIINKKSLHLPMNPARLEQILAGFAGANVTIKENIGKNQFGVWIEKTDGSFSNEDVKTIRKELKRRKQCQLIFELVYHCDINISPLHGISYFQHLKETVPVGANTYNQYKGNVNNDLKNNSYYQLLSLGGIK